MFFPKSEEVEGGWRRLGASPNNITVMKSRKIRRAGHIVHMGEIRNMYRILVGEPEGKRQLGRHRSRWEDNITKDLR
jgi:hypothetical protein